MSRPTLKVLMKAIEAARKELDELQGQISDAESAIAEAEDTIGNASSAADTLYGLIGEIETEAECLSEEIDAECDELESKVEDAKSASSD